MISIKRSIYKTISYRIIAVIATVLFLYIITGQFIVSLSIGTMLNLMKVILYFCHERIWAKIKEE